MTRSKGPVVTRERADRLSEAMRKLDPHCHPCNLAVVRQFSDESGKLRRMCGPHTDEYVSRHNVLDMQDVSHQYQAVLAEAPENQGQAGDRMRSWKRGALASYKPPQHGRLTCVVSQTGSRRGVAWVTVKITGGAVDEEWHVGRMYTVWESERGRLKRRVSP